MLLSQSLQRFIMVAGSLHRRHCTLYLFNMLLLLWVGQVLSFPLQTLSSLPSVRHSSPSPLHPPSTGSAFSPISNSGIQVDRLDASFSPKTGFSYNPSSGSPTPLASALVTPASLISSNDSSDNDLIIIKLSCDASGKVTAKRCQQVQLAFESAKQRILSTFALKQTIVVKAVYGSFCAMQEECNTGAIGFAAPSCFVPLQNTSSMDPNYLYPQALARQYEQKRNYLPYDIEANFNSDVDKTYWFKGDPPITSDKVDFEYVVVHELLHGLGFISLWTSKVSDLVSAVDPSLVSSKSNTNLGNLLTPPPHAKGPPNAPSTSVQNVLISGFLPPTIFDKFIYDQQINTPLSTYYNLFQEFCKQGQAPSWTKDFLSHPNYVKLANLLYGRAITPSTFVLSLQHVTPGGTSNSGVLHTRPFSGKFQDGSSISHLDQEIYTNKDDFLMRPVVTNGATLDSEIAKGLQLFGPVIRTIFAEMGYVIISDVTSNTLSSPAQLQANDSKSSSTCRSGDIDASILQPLEASRALTPSEASFMLPSKLSTIVLLLVPIWFLHI